LLCCAVLALSLSLEYFSRLAEARRTTQIDLWTD